MRACASLSRTSDSSCRVVAAIVAPLSTPSPKTGYRSAFPPWPPPPRAPDGADDARDELAGAIESDLAMIESLLAKGGALSLPPSIAAAHATSWPSAVDTTAGAMDLLKTVTSGRRTPDSKRSCALAPSSPGAVSSRGLP
jgi:hypothetical protein